MQAVAYWGMNSYKILRSTGRYIVLITHTDGTRSWSQWFTNKAQARAWIAEQTTGLATPDASASPGVPASASRCRLSPER